MADTENGGKTTGSASPVEAVGATARAQLAKRLADSDPEKLDLPEEV